MVTEPRACPSQGNSEPLRFLRCLASHPPAQAWGWRVVGCAVLQNELPEADRGQATDDLKTQNVLSLISNQGHVDGDYDDTLFYFHSLGKN